MRRHSSNYARIRDCAPSANSRPLGLPFLCPSDRPARLLSEGYSAIVDGELTIYGVSIRIDGVQKASGRSRPGEFNYEPILFHEGPRAREPQRVLLSVLALLLSYIQGKVPDRGVIYQGPEAATTTVLISGRMKSAELILDDLHLMQLGEVRPSLVLNDHCGVCEFRQRCHEQAVREDNLSLLRGVSEKDIRAHGRRGVLTLTQLAHTFRPRRDGKLPGWWTARRYHGRFKLAIRANAYMCSVRPRCHLRECASF